ncbi:hypothetical protein [Vitiosangium sp. GDMCC 1.1324]|uniref:hypothetical protein n=1 Tax=Vitiosangium sp. (strain GDMCC 1.1324) TaxID=2138576 RepID=UPI000D36B1C5|nr:hypothetical protein [Vitiosangium sp. GDMCC 1.1324]PTL76643.1 hypothetical protein DAT35_47745 [Vitiosangium sp. GDMCC 1.1324]
MSMSWLSRTPGFRWRLLLVLAAALFPFQTFAKEACSDCPMGMEKHRHHEGTGGSAAAEESAPAWPRLGGHVGLALPVVKFQTGGVSAIGADFLQVGLAPGVTVMLDEHWAVDFEVVGYSIWRFASDSAAASSSTALVVDPGVIYNFGPVATGLRLAMQTGGGVPVNGGLIPLVNKGFPIGKMKWFIELDLPFFVLGSPGTTTVSFSPQVHTGIAF